MAAIMNDWLKIILPLVLTAMGALVFDLFLRVSELEHELVLRDRYQVVFEQFRKELNDHEERIRDLDDNVCHGP